jgi:hypothetical protein
MVFEMIEIFNEFKDRRRKVRDYNILLKIQERNMLFIENKETGVNFYR